MDSGVIPSSRGNDAEEIATTSGLIEAALDPAQLHAAGQALWHLSAVLERDKIGTPAC